MAVADKITSIKQHVTNAYTAIQGKGGTIPTKKNIENLNAAITSIATQKPEEEKTATPTKTTQEIVPDSGKALSKVTVNPIPSEYITTTDATAAASDILSGKTAYVKGSKVTGTIATYSGGFSVLSAANVQMLSTRAVEPPVLAQTVQTDTSANGIIEIDNPDEMAALLTEENVGKIYKYVGESNGTFENGEIYVVEA